MVKSPRKDGDLPVVLARTLELLKANSTSSYVVKNYNLPNSKGVRTPRDKRLVSKDIARLILKRYVKKTSEIYKSILQ